MPEFNKLYFTKRLNLYWRARHVCQALQKALHFASVIDVGCSVGEFVEWFEDHGADAWGMDNAEVLVGEMFRASNLILHDVTIPLENSRRYDLALCFEVASILEPADCVPLAHNLITLSDQIVMTQPGVCEGIILDAGYTRNLAAETIIKEELEKWKNKPAIKAIYHAVAVYKRS